MTQKEKGKEKKRRYNNGRRPCVLLCFEPSLRLSTLGRCILGKRWWHQRKFLSSRLQRFATLCSHPAGNSKHSPNCAAVSVYILFPKTLCWRGNFIRALVTAFSVNALKKWESSNSLWHKLHFFTEGHNLCSVMETVFNVALKKKIDTKKRYTNGGKHAYKGYSIFFCGFSMFFYPFACVWICRQGMSCYP